MKSCNEIGDDECWKLDQIWIMDCELWGHELRMKICFRGTEVGMLIGIFTSRGDATQVAPENEATRVLGGAE